MPLLPPSPSKRARFHPLTVLSVEPLTDTSVAVTFDLPHELASEYAYRAGQHLTLRLEASDGEGVDDRRSYSICQSPRRATTTRTLKIGVSEFPGGAVSPRVVHDLRSGDVVDVMTPLGPFTVPEGDGSPREHVSIAAGSGITPVLAIVQSLLEDTDDRVTLIYGNRSHDTVMFLEELSDLKDAHPTRFNLIHVLSREEQDVELFSGRLDRAKIGALLDQLVDVPAVDGFYLCGPMGVVLAAEEALKARDVPTERIHHEIFHVDVPEDAQPAAPGGTGIRMTPTLGLDPDAPPAARLQVNLDGRTTQVDMATRDETILAATLRRRPDAPYSCTGGVCGTCRARVVAGEVRMDRNFALAPDEVAAGVILACQSHPVTDEVSIDYDV